jgi:pimeloyl-ACP methyl ester carboxylesterase
MRLDVCGSGESILFIHGMPTSGRLWKSVTSRLCERFTCFTLDLPGLGKSPQAEYGPDYLRDLAGQIDALRIEQKIDKWHVVGHDAGSVVAVHYARYFPEHVDCMALLAPALFPDLKPYFLIEPLRMPIIGEVLAPIIRTLFWKVAMQRALEGEENAVEVAKDFYEPFSGFMGSWRFMRVLRWGKPSRVLAQVPDFLPGLLMPTLIFHGSNDRAIPESFAHRASSLLPNSSLLILNSGHFIPLQQPGPVANCLVEFFATQNALRETSSREPLAARLV